MKTDEINTNTNTDTSSDTNSDTNINTGKMKLLAEAGGSLAVGVLALAGVVVLALALPFAAIYDAVSSFIDETCRTCCKAYDFKL